MRISAFIPLALALDVCTGCTTVHHEFYGSGASLKKSGERIPASTNLKVSVTCSGGAPNGDHYVAFQMRRENCWLVLFHPPVPLGSSLRVNTSSGDAGAWLVRGKRLDCASLARSGREAPFLADRGERLHGFIEVVWEGDDDFSIPVELDGEAGETAVHGHFTAYRALWKALAGPAMLLGLWGKPELRK